MSEVTKKFCAFRIDHDAHKWGDHFGYKYTCEGWVVNA